MKLFTEIGIPKNKKNKINYSINLNELEEGISSFDQFFVNKNKKKLIFLIEIVTMLVES